MASQRVTEVPSAHRPPGLGWTQRITPGRAWAPLETLGHHLDFTWQTMRGVPQAATAYRGQTLGILTDITWGRRAIVVGGGVVPVLVILGASIGAMLAILGYTTLHMLGLGPITGTVTAFAATRELAPIIAAIGFAAQAGCRMTAEIGSMRIAEEIDALQAQAIRPIPFVVSTRVLAGTLAVIPTYLIALSVAYLSAGFMITVVYGEGAGAFDHYFRMFITPTDVLFSMVKVIVFVGAVILAHAYQGFYASGGPEGVGIASGRAIRASTVLIIVLDMILTVLMWGFSSSISFSG